MRFINTVTVQLEYVSDSELHLEKSQYIILSHRWGDTTSIDRSDKEGFPKNQGRYNVAVSERCRYA